VTPQQAEALQLIGERGVVSRRPPWLLPGSTRRPPVEISPASSGLLCRQEARREDGRQTDVRLTQKGKRTAEAVSTERAAAFGSLLDRIPRGRRNASADALDVSPDPR